MYIHARKHKHYHTLAHTHTMSDGYTSSGRRRRHCRRRQLHVVKHPHTRCRSPLFFPGPSL